MTAKGTSQYLSEDCAGKNLNGPKLHVERFKKHTRNDTH